ncbi:hypothetical protein [Nocardia abscessus]|nr:hypothetical protein [Nocardia abscessus]
MHREVRRIDDEVLAHISPAHVPLQQIHELVAFGRAEPTRNHRVECL